MRKLGLTLQGLALLGLLAFAVGAHASVTILPSDPGITWSPQTWTLFLGSWGMAGNAAHATVLLNNTTTITVTVNGYSNAGEICFLVDRPVGAPQCSAVIAGNTAISVTVPSATAGAAAHILDIDVPVAGQALSPYIVNIIIDNGGSASAVVSSSNKILMMGDSEQAATQVISLSVDDGRLSYAYMQRFFTGAEVGMAAYYGAGWGPTGGGSNLSVNWPYFENPAGPLRSWSGLTLVLVTLGVNDSNSDDITGYCETVLTGILGEASFASTAKVGVMQDALNPNINRSTQLQNCVASVNATYPSRAVYVDNSAWIITSGALHPPGWQTVTYFGPNFSRSLAAISGLGFTLGGWRQ